MYTAMAYNALFNAKKSALDKKERLFYVFMHLKNTFGRSL